MTYTNLIHLYLITPFIILNKEYKNTMYSLDQSRLFKPKDKIFLHRWFKTTRFLQNLLNCKSGSTKEFKMYIAKKYCFKYLSRLCISIFTFPYHLLTYQSYNLLGLSYNKGASRENGTWSVNWFISMFFCFLTRDITFMSMGDKILSLFFEYQK